MTTDDDITRWLVRNAMAAGMSRDAAIWLALRMRSDWGGCRVYVPKPGPEGKGWVLGAAVAAGTSIQAAASELGIPRSTAYRVTARRWVLDWV